MSSTRKATSGSSLSTKTSPSPRTVSSTSAAKNTSFEQAHAKREFGKTGLFVSPLGFGAGGIGDPSTSENQVETLLNTVLDSGINLIDSARSYGLSEERIGRHLKRRRSEYVLSTKIGYGIPGFADWTGPCIAAGVDAALHLLQTEWIDIVHLHSCPLSTLQAGEVVEALNRAVQQGKVRVAAYSGDNEPLRGAIADPRFASIQASLNICDQRFLDAGLAEAAQRGLGIIAKRSVANAPWRFHERPTAPDVAAYWDRWRAMGIDPAPCTWSELACVSRLICPACTPVLSALII